MRTAIVIGAGPGGLVAANHLADAGAEVLVLEARARSGGRAASDDYEGLVLNQGPHALYVGGAGVRGLAELGIRPDGWNPVSPLGSFLLPGPTTARRTPGGPRTALGLTRFLARVLRGGTVADGLSVTQWLDANLDDERARAAAAALVRVTTFVADHDHLSAEVAAAQLRVGAAGVRYLGPWQRLIDALERRARGRGVRILRRSAARAIEASAQGWSVDTDDGEHSAEMLVVAPGSPAAASRLLGERFQGRLPEAPRAAHVASLDLGLRRLPEPRRRFALGIREPHYLSIHSPKDAETAIVTVAAYLAPADETSGARSRLEEVADLMQPGWREQLVATRYLPRMTAVPLIPAPAEGRSGRPDVADLDAPGLALAGDWVGPEGLLTDAAIASGARAARHLLAAPAALTA